MFMEILLTFINVPLKILRSLNILMVFLTLALTPLILQTDQTIIPLIQDLCEGDGDEVLKWTALTLECVRQTPGGSWLEEEEEQV